MPEGRVIDPEGQQSPGQGWGYIMRLDGDDIDTKKAKSWPGTVIPKVIPFHNANNYKVGDPVTFEVKWATLTGEGGEVLPGKIGYAAEIT